MELGEQTAADPLAVMVGMHGDVDDLEASITEPTPLTLSIQDGCDLVPPPVPRAGVNRESEPCHCPGSVTG